MSKISLAPDASGTGIFTIASPNSNTNRTLTLPDDTGTIVTNSGNQAGSFTTLNTSGAVVFNDAGADVDFRVEGDTDANLLFVDASTDRVGIGTTSPAAKIEVVGGTGLVFVGRFRNGDATGANNSGVDILCTSSATAGNRVAQILLDADGANSSGSDYLAIAKTGNSGNAQISQVSNAALIFSTNATERMRITSGGEFLVGTTTSNPIDNIVAGCSLNAYNGLGIFSRSNGDALAVQRLTNDGALVVFYQDGTQEGTISVSGTTVSYNGGNLSRWAQMLTKPDLVKGTVMSNLDEMNVYVKPTLYWTEEDELPVDEEGNPTAAVGDVKQETSVSENEQLNKVKVSDVEGDANVAGVFVNWTYDEAHQVDEINMAMTGDMIIRIAQGVTVSRGDLLMSAGDGTAKPQGDDIVRSKTIAKVTSTHVTCTYEDGSYCVPCVLMAC
jgi:hypothetical protein